MWRVYSRRNTITNQEYIGKTTQTLERRAGKNGIQYRRKHGPLGKAIEEYGWPNFVSEVLEVCETEELANEREQYYIRERNTLWPTGYNRETGGRNFQHHTETKNLMSESHKRSVNKGNKRGKKKGCKGGKGREKGFTTSKETKEKMSKSHSKRSVLQYTIDGQLKAEYPSIMEASRRTGINPGNISNCCKGRRKIAGNSTDKYIWVFKQTY